MEYQFRQYQEDAVNACLERFDQAGLKSIMLESPVGSGKTLMALQIIERLQKHLGRRLRVNWVAPHHHLLQQVMQVNQDLNREDIHPVSLFEKYPPTADFVVLDEAHHEATQSCVLLYEKMHNQWTLGLSATPLRTDRMKLSFQDTVSTCSIGRLIRDGYLSPFHSYLLPHYDTATVAECLLKEPQRWGKSLVFFPTIRECFEFQERLHEGGIACEVVTAESDKDRQLEEFVSNRVKVIANVLMLTEGFDQPDVQSIFARDASRLPTIQMCGRGLRRAPGKSQCNIVQSCDTPYLFEKVAPAQNAFRMMGGKWLALRDGTAEINSTLARSLELLAWKAGGLPRGNATTTQQSPRAAAINSSEYYQTFGFIYRELYEIVQLCNRTCWEGTLPPCAITVTRQAQINQDPIAFVPKRTIVNGITYPALCFNLAKCDPMEPSVLLAELLHAMTHLWQHTQGQRNGHGKEFYQELDRIGLEIPSDGAPNFHRDGEAGTVCHAIQKRYPGLSADLHRLNVTRLRPPRQGDLSFFALQLQRPA